MKNKNSLKGYVLFAGMAVLIVSAWYNALGNTHRDEELLDDYLSRVSEHEEKEAYITAAGYCVKALEIRKDDAEIMLRAADNYLKCGDRNAFLKYCRMAAEEAPESDRSWLAMGEYYFESGDIKTAMECLEKAPGNDMPEDIKNLENHIRGSYSMGNKKFSCVKGFYNQYCAVSDEKGRWGLADENGQLQLVMKYDDIGACSTDEDVIPVCNEGKWYFSDLEGRIKYVPNRKYDYLGSYSCGFAPFSADGEYGYMRLDYKEETKKYDYAGAFSEGAAAVRKAGKWAVIDDSLNEITGYIFDDIELDDYGFCVKNGIISAVKNGKQVSLDVHGNEVSDKVQAVCGFTPVECDDLWGFADENGEVLTDICFDDVYEFSENGRTCVLQDGYWRIMILDLYR